MKKVLASVLSLMLLAATSLDVSAVQRQRRYSRTECATSDYRDRERRSESYYEDDYRDRSVWNRSRDKITTAAGAAGGAAIGAAVGGKKGALIGAIVGGAGSALYTYKIRKKDRRY